VQITTSEPRVRRDSLDVTTRRAERRRAEHRRRTIALVAATLVVVVVMAALFVKTGSEPTSTSTRTQASNPPRPTTTAAPTAVALGTGGVTPFSPKSFWNTPLAADAAVAPNSQQLVSSFDQQWRDNYGTVGINSDDFSMPIYRVPAGQATVAVSIATDCNSDAGLLAQINAVPIPANAQPANGTDHSLVIWQPSTDTEWELWMAQRADDGSWSACWGGRIENVSEAQGVFPSPYGVAASGMSYLAGAIKASELQAGRIDHALAVNVVHAAKGTQVAPANRTDGDSTAPDAIPEGTRFRLDPSIDVTKLGLPAGGVAIARALQEYGMYVTDKSGAVVLTGESSAPYVAAGQPNPYDEAFGGLQGYEVLGKIPWDRLQVVQPVS
jgi:hypothetical protein